MALPVGAFTPADWTRTQQFTLVTGREAEPDPRYNPNGAPPRMFYLHPGRVTIHTSKRRQVRGNGDLIIKQVRSTAGTSERQRRILRSLGLGRIGKQRRHHGYEPAELRQIKIIEHLLDVRAVVSYTPDDQPLEADAMSTREYTIADRPALRIDYTGGEYAQAELHDHYFSMAWTSDHSAAAFVRALAALYPRIETTSGHGVVVKIPIRPDDHPTSDTNDDPTPVETSAWKALKDARWDASVAFLRLDYPGITLTWGINSDDENEPLGQVGLISYRHNPTELRRLIHATATRRVAKNADQLLHKQLAFLADGVTPGMLWTA